MRTRIASLVAALCVVLGAGCGNSSQQTGELGKAVFTASNCGGVVNSSLAGCDLTKKFAIGGLVDMRVARVGSGAQLQLRADPSDILLVTDAGSGLYTLSAQLSGKTVLTAFDANGDVDHMTINVEAIAVMAYNTASSGFGTFKLQPGGGDIDGFFTLGDSVTSFTFLFLQVDGDSNSMLGRDSFSYELSPGLNFQQGKDMPHALQFDLLRPAPGDYTLTVRAKLGAGRFKMQVTAN